VIGSDPKTDVALIKVNGKSDFPFVKFADHSPRICDWVVAVGNPFGLGGTVTAGIVRIGGLALSSPGMVCRDRLALSSRSGIR
jgi:serine protease Do